MQAISRFVMRGPVQASLVAGLAFAIPFLHWLGGAVLGLVVLRLGLRASVTVIAWSALPALAWAMVGATPGPLLVLMMVVLMAAILQQSMSWERVLLSGAAAALVIGQALPVVSPGVIEQPVSQVQAFVQELEEQLKQEGVASDDKPMLVQMARDQGDDFQRLLHQTFLVAIPLLNFMLALVAMFLARGAQARLFNPGGFQREFHRLKFSPAGALIAVVAMGILPLIGFSGALAQLAFGIPLVVAGIALIHGVVAMAGLGRGWLVLFYVMMVLLGIYLVIVLVFGAIFDSWLDFRKRLEAKSPEA